MPNKVGENLHLIIQSKKPKKISNPQNSHDVFSKDHFDLKRHKVCKKTYGDFNELYKNDRFKVVVKKGCCLNRSQENLRPCYLKPPDAPIPPEDDKKTK